MNEDRADQWVAARTGYSGFGCWQFEILEVFAVKQQRMNASQLHLELGYPKSSLSGLLKSLIRTGYLVTTGSAQEYFPTLKLTRLGEWVPSALLGSESLLPTLEWLRDETGEAVTQTIAGAGNDLLNCGWQPKGASISRRTMPHPSPARRQCCGGP
jgi:DNA-binding IclR family transcriptional regulator